MNAAELKDLLESEGYAHRWYSFDRGEPPIDGYILEKVAERWTVFYFERGESRNIASFESESDASEFFYHRMREDFGSTVDRVKH